MKETVRHYYYSPYERAWHWLQAAGIGLLTLSGLAIHSRGLFGWIPFEGAVRAHNLLGFLLLANAFLGLFYYLTTGTIRQYLPQTDFLTTGIRQAKFYLGGIFRGEAHPLEKSPSRRLNPLQQATYLGVLNVLLPLQIVTGLMIWGAQRWPAAVASVGGLPTLTLLHTLGAWLFAAFVVMHVYLTTTGREPLTNVKAMLLGYEDTPAEETHHAP